MGFVWLGVVWVEDTQIRIAWVESCQGGSCLDQNKLPIVGSFLFTTNLIWWNFCLGGNCCLASIRLVSD